MRVTKREMEREKKKERVREKEKQQMWKPFFGKPFSAVAVVMAFTTNDI